MDPIEVRFLLAGELCGLEAVGDEGARVSAPNLADLFGRVWSTWPATAAWAYVPLAPGAPAEVYSDPQRPGVRYRVLGRLTPDAPAPVPELVPTDDPWARRARHQARAAAVRDAALAEARALATGYYMDDGAIRRWAGVLAWAEGHAARSNGRDLPPETERAGWWPRGAYVPEGGSPRDHKGRRHASNGDAWTAAAAAAATELLGTGPCDARAVALLCTAEETAGKADLAASVAASVLASSWGVSWTGDRAEVAAVWARARRVQQAAEEDEARRSAALALSATTVAEIVGALGADDAVARWLDPLWVQTGDIYGVRAGLRIGPWMFRAEVRETIPDQEYEARAARGMEPLAVVGGAAAKEAAQDIVAHVLRAMFLPAEV